MMDNTEFLLTSSTTTVALWNCDNWHRLKEYQNDDNISPKCLDTYSRDYIITGSSEPPKLNQWLLQKDEVHQNTSLKFPGKVACFVISNNDELLIVAMDCSIIVWNAISGQLIRAQAHESRITCMKLSMPGDKLIVGFENGMMLAYKNFLLSRPVASVLDSVRPVFRKHDHMDSIVDMHAGRYTYIPKLATISLDQTYCIYEANIGNLLVRSGFYKVLTSVVVDKCFKSVLIGMDSGVIKKVYLWYASHSHQITIHKHLAI